MRDIILSEAKSEAIFQIKREDIKKTLLIKKIPSKASCNDISQGGLFSKKNEWSEKDLKEIRSLRKSECNNKRKNGIMLYIGLSSSIIGFIIILLYGFDTTSQLSTTTIGITVGLIFLISGIILSIAGYIFNKKSNVKLCKALFITDYNNEMQLNNACKTGIIK